MYIFVIDTEQYAGNFNREMCAFVTGQIGDCTIGDDFADMVPQDVSKRFRDIVAQTPDEHGCHRPVKMWATEGWFNHGMGGDFREGEEKQALEDYRKECLKYAEHKVHPNDREAHEKRWKENAEKPLHKYAAYLSVGILFYDRPPDDLIELMKERANELMTKCTSKGRMGREGDEPIAITGFRLVEEKVVTEEIAQWENN
jgi:hypothetical protein